LFNPSQISEGHKLADDIAGLQSVHIYKILLFILYTSNFLGHFSNLKLDFSLYGVFHVIETLLIMRKSL